VQKSEKGNNLDDEKLIPTENSVMLHK